MMEIFVLTNLKDAILDIFSCSDEYMNGGFSFSQGLNGTFPWSKPSIFRLDILFWLCLSTLHNFKFFWWVFDKCDISWPWKGQAIQAINHTLFRIRGLRSCNVPSKCFKFTLSYVYENPCIFPLFSLRTNLLFSLLVPWLCKAFMS